MSLAWDEVLDNLRPYKSGAVVAIHKPLLLLMILARAQRREDNEFPFREIGPRLQKGLRDLAQSASPPHPEYPFWRLRNDGCWIIEDEDFFLGLERSEGPTNKDLMDHEAIARVPDALWRPLLEEQGLIDRLAESILTTYFPASQSREEALIHSGLRLKS
jgi:putative restriction endonuclease